MAKLLIMLGAGGHASVLMDMLKRLGLELHAVVSPDRIPSTSLLSGITRIETDELLVNHYSPDQVVLVNGVGSMPGHDVQKKLFLSYSELGYCFLNVVSPQALVSEHVKLGMGVQIMAGAIVQTGAKIGNNSIINSGAIVEHDCIIGSHNHVAPGATLSGGVVTGSSVHIGTGANVIQNITIGDSAIIGAGTTLVKNVGAGQRVIPSAMRFLS
ncbi:acetyltransferase [Nitrincola nitratireducens]|uniref:2,3,4,5-tetrahydropyridine-2,6-dicarboxylate N-acetyltransferase n=1 Tax=Nitrincola nitratireducens TaxID=1229521 RepID=W9UYF9_9GAMM|nr:acetyltransferase [Nitrincola nitratireducens]EXJ09756.1 2,3,4,5-tetrahydropyridine-2,6-dicarboxylate N-acetyltransferase [Nitrincola nitratireducens]